MTTTLQQLHTCKLFGSPPPWNFFCFFPFRLSSGCWFDFLSSSLLQANLPIILLFRVLPNYPWNLLLVKGKNFLIQFITLPFALIILVHPLRHGIWSKLKSTMLQDSRWGREKFFIQLKDSTINVIWLL